MKIIDNQEKPVRPDRFNHWLKKMHCSVKDNSPMMRIPGIVMFQVETLQTHYYGSYAKAGLALLRKAFYLWWNDKLTHCFLWISDSMGWTKVYDIPETPEYVAHQQRHGRKCSGSPNCQNDQCIDDSLPKWFRWLWRKRFE